LTNSSPPGNPGIWKKESSIWVFQNRVIWNHYVPITSYWEYLKNPIEFCLAIVRSTYMCGTIFSTSSSTLSPIYVYFSSSFLPGCQNLWRCVPTVLEAFQLSYREASKLVHSLLTVKSLPYKIDFLELNWNQNRKITRFIRN
jgi:hypothetical protein